MQPNDTARLCGLCQTPFTPHPGDPGIFCSRDCYQTHRRAVAVATRETRFWSYVDRSSDSGCWLWTRSTCGIGYGQFTIGHGRNVMTHRMAWTLATGETLVRADVIGHICDTPLCVRNDDAGSYEVNGLVLPRQGHLFKGTVLDNNADMAQKERYASGDASGPRLHRERMRHGVAHPWSKLTEDQVRAIRRQYASGGVTQKTLGAQYGVTPGGIHRIIARQVWRDVE